MAAGNVARIIRAPGFIVMDPSDLADPEGDSTYGTGTLIGKTMAFVLQQGGEPLRVEYESYGDAGDVLEPDKAVAVGFVCRGVDDDAFNKLFGSDNVSTGAVSQHAVYKEPGTSIPGASAISRARKILYVPDDPVHVPSLLVYRAIPQWVPNAEIQMSRNQEMVLPIAADCIRDGNGLIYSWGRLVDLSLTA